MARWHTIPFAPAGGRPDKAGKLAQRALSVVYFIFLCVTGRITLFLNYWFEAVSGRGGLLQHALTLSHSGPASRRYVGQLGINEYVPHRPP